MNQLLCCICALLLIKLNHFISAIPLIKYDEDEARRMLSMSAAAYSTTPELCLNQTFPFNEVWRIETGVNRTCDIVKNNCSTFIAISDEKKEIIIAFREAKTKLQDFLVYTYLPGPDNNFYSMGKVNIFVYF